MLLLQSTNLTKARLGFFCWLGWLFRSRALEKNCFYPKEMDSLIFTLPTDYHGKKKSIAYEHFTAGSPSRRFVRQKHPFNVLARASTVPGTKGDSIELPLTGFKTSWILCYVFRLSVSQVLPLPLLLPMKPLRIPSPSTNLSTLP